MDRIAILGLLQHRLPGLQAVYAFGSRSQGTATSRSDLDLAVLTPERLDPVALWELGAEVAKLVGCDVDLVDLRRATTVMQHQVLVTGQRWWVQSALTVDLWELQVLRDKQELDELRAPLVEEILRSGVVHGG
ncbi:MAG: type VII toxin-antitoxin system MntA family adenylyltransferase antitoxin [Nevskiaceae bacterium]